MKSKSGGTDFKYEKLKNKLRICNQVFTYIVGFMITVLYKKRNFEIITLEI